LGSLAGLNTLNLFVSWYAFPWYAARFVFFQHIALLEIEQLSQRVHTQLFWVIDRVIDAVFTGNCFDRPIIIYMVALSLLVIVQE
jgi:hypothetical protein